MHVFGAALVIISVTLNIQQLLALRTFHKERSILHWQKAWLPHTTTASERTRTGTTERRPRNGQNDEGGKQEKKQEHTKRVHTKQQHYDVCIAGAGLSGSVLAERYATELKKSVLVVDTRYHIGGNCYDYKDSETGIRVSRYGAHLFHTIHKTVFQYLKRFGPWVRYDHKVRGIVNGKNVPIPVNIETVNTLFGLKITSKQQMEAWLQQEQIPLPTDTSNINSEDVALSRVGRRLYDLIFKPYTIKQWATEPSNLGPEVLSRIPVRADFEDRYFSDPYQALPMFGYTALFKAMLSSPLIKVRTNTDYFADVRDNDAITCDKVYFTGPIDAYFASTGWPKLAYRSLDFQRIVAKNTPSGFFQKAFVVNHPQADADFTRIVEYKHLPGAMVDSNKEGSTVYFIERSKDDGEPYYPVPNPENKALYARYQQLALKENVTFVGRLANYKYFNMDEAVKNALELFERDTGIPYQSAAGTSIAAESVDTTSSNNDSFMSRAETLKPSAYLNLPPVDMTNPEFEASLQRTLQLPVDKPYGLRHEAHPPGPDAVMGLAAYPKNMGTFPLMVGSLRQTGYDGHIILGVHKDIPPEEEEYLKVMDVTYYIAEFVDCDESIMDAGTGGG
jgi:UDP-galactopyranose mutase